VLRILSRYDEAVASFSRVLAVDPVNQAARENLDRTRPGVKAAGGEAPPQVTIPDEFAEGMLNYELLTGVPKDPVFAQEVMKNPLLRARYETLVGRQKC
jgi:hypothetical protein